MKLWRWVIVLCVSLLIIQFSLGFYYSNQSKIQKQRNTFLISQVRTADAKINEIRHLEQKLSAMMTSLGVIQDLRNFKRSNLDFLSKVVKSIPAQWSVKELTHLGNVIELTVEMEKSAELELGLIRIKSSVNAQSLVLISDKNFSNMRYREVRFKLVASNNLSKRSGENL